MLQRIFVSAARGHCAPSSSFHHFGFRALSTDVARKRRSEMFEKERRRQRDESSATISKVIVSVVSLDGQEKHLLMNDRLSTYFDCAKHVSSVLARNTALASVTASDEEEGVVVSAHSPIDGESKLRLLEFNSATHQREVNKAYWRSCAFLLGAVVESSFRSDVLLVEALPPEYESGRFVYRAEIEGLSGWEPSKGELDVLTRSVHRNFLYNAYSFVPLTVDRDFALDLFADNPYKKDRVIDGTESTVTVYKVGDHVDISEGPLISNTDQIGRFAVTQAVDRHGIFSFSGVSLPASLRCSSYSWDLILAASLSPSAVRPEERRYNAADAV